MERDRYDRFRVAHANAQFVTIGAISYPTNFNVNILYFSIQDDPCNYRGYQCVPHDVGRLIHAVHFSANYTHAANSADQGPPRDA